MHFGEFRESVQILICLYSVNPCLIYREELILLKDHRNGSSRSLCKIEAGEEIHIAEAVYRTRG